MAANPQVTPFLRFQIANDAHIVHPPYLLFAQEILKVKQALLKPNSTGSTNDKPKKRSSRCCTAARHNSAVVKIPNDSSTIVGRQLIKQILPLLENMNSIENVTQIPCSKWRHSESSGSS